MATEQMSLLQQANVSIANFARYCGIHRVTVSMWIHKPETKPRGLYWEKASAVLKLIDKGLKAGVFPMDPHRRSNYTVFASKLERVAALPDEVVLGAEPAAGTI